MAPGIWQILIIVVLVMILFGAGRIPTIMENLAKGVKSFKKGLNEDDAPAAPSNEKVAQEQTKPDGKE